MLDDRRGLLRRGVLREGMTLEALMMLTGCDLGSAPPVKPVDAAHWTLDVTGRVADRKRWSLPKLAVLPQADMVIRHVWVEGWDYIGE